MRLLVAEDEPRLALLLKRGFEQQGYSADVTGDGAEALWLATEADYDAIVLDVMLPSVDGLEVTRRLRAGGRWAPVLLLTARDGIDDRVAGLDAGADDYLVKPFSFAELVRPDGSTIDVDLGAGFQLLVTNCDEGDRTHNQPAWWLPWRGRVHPALKQPVSRGPSGEQVSELFPAPDDERSRSDCRA